MFCIYNKSSNYPLLIKALIILLDMETSLMKPTYKYEVYDIFEDVSEDDVLGSVNDIISYRSDKPKTYDEFLGKSLKEYNYTIFINFNNNKLIGYDGDINIEIGKMLYKIYSLFDLYGIECSDTIIIQQNKNTDELVECKLGNHITFSTFDTILKYRLSSVLLCFQEPKFTFKNSITFMYIMCQIVFTQPKIKIADSLQIYDGVYPNFLSYYEQSYQAFYKAYHLEMNINDIYSVINWPFFYKTIHLFFGLQISDKMETLVKKHNKNPFTGKPLYPKK